MGGRGSGSGFRAVVVASAAREPEETAREPEVTARAEAATTAEPAEGRTPYDTIDYAPSREAHRTWYLRGVAAMAGKELTDSLLRSIILTSRSHVASTQYAETLGQLEAITRPGDVLASMDDNRWHDIEQTMERTATGWHYKRTDLRTGEVYDEGDLAGGRAADTFISDPDREVWRIKRKVAR